MGAISVASRIVRVVVHARGAVVTRRVELPEGLPEGSCTLLLEDLPAESTPGSLRATVAGGRPVVALRSRVTRAQASEGETPAEALAELEASLRDAEAEMERHTRRRDSLRSASPSFDVNTEPQGERAADDPLVRIQAGLGVSEVLGAASQEAQARLQAASERAEELRQEIEALRAQAGGGSSDRADSPRRAVEVGLGPGGGLTRLDVDYVVPSARWWPAYTARIDAGGEGAEWVLEALVAQASGEDWKEVQLGLSTADLIADARLPSLPSLRLGRAQPPVRRGFRPPPPGLEALFQGYDDFEERRASVAVKPKPSKPRGRPGRVQDKDYGDPFAGGEAFEVMDADRSELVLEDSCYDQTLSVGGGEVTRSGSMAFRAPGAAPQSMSKSGGFLTRTGSVLSSSVPTPSKKRRASGRKMAKERGPLADAFKLTADGAMIGGATMDMLRQLQSGGGGLPPELPEPSVEPEDDWLDFDHLILRGPDEPGRGTLHRDDADAAQADCLPELERLDPENAADPCTTRGRFDHRFLSEGVADVPSDARVHRVTLGAHQAASRVRYVTVPQIEDVVYREVELRNPLDAPLLAGPVDVFWDGALLTSSSIRSVGRGGPVRFGLGVEDRLRVARNARVQESTSGLLSGHTTVEHEVTIELRSGLGSEVEVEVLDRVPVVSEHVDDLTVTWVRATPAGADYDQRDRDAPVEGGKRWVVPVPAGGKAEVQFVYALGLPAKRKVVGGNRRD